MSMILSLLLVAQTAGAQPTPKAAAAEPTPKATSIPEQNQKKFAIETIPPYDPAPLLKNLNGEVSESDPQTLFFPADAFDLVKGIKDPGAYHKQLVSWFAADLDKERARLKAGAPWTIESFKLGFCKWKEKGSEANALPYWSCYKSKVKLKNAKNESNIVEIRALINWGTQWYPTHLLPIPAAKK